MVTMAVQSRDGIDGFRGPLAEALSPSGPLSAGGLLAPADRALPVSPAADRVAWSRVDGPTLAAVTRRAAADRGTPWPQPLASQAARVHGDGDRDTWEQAAYARQRRLSRAVLLAAATLDDAWLDEVVDGVWMLCEQSSWCWPAHEDDRSRAGSVLADARDPFVDLGAGEVVAQLAWIDHVLGGPLDDRYPGVRARIRREARHRVLDPFARRDDWHWIGLDGDVHNWNPWIAGNVLVAALRLLDDAGGEDHRADVVTRAVACLDRYVRALPEDGAVDEGYAYWWNGACRALEALDVLAHATDGAWDAASVAALRATVAFPHRSHLGGDWYVDHADSSARQDAEQPWHAVHRAARRVGDAAAAAHAAAHRGPGIPAATEREGLGRLLRGATDAAWIDAAPTDPPLPRQVWLPSVQVMLARVAAGSAAGLAVVVKGGHNGEHHNHDDVGSFMVACDGIPLVVDAGRPTYTAATFGPGRSRIWTMQSDWHNVPSVRGTPQATGRRAAAADASVALGDASSAFEAELAAAYPGAGLVSWRRRVALERSPQRVVVEDRWDLDPWEGPGEEPPTTVRLLLAGRVDARAGEALVRHPGSARGIRIGWDPRCAHALAEQPLSDPMLTSVWGDRLLRLDIDAAGVRSLRVTVDMDTSIGDRT